MMADQGGFDHQRQTLRVVTLLENRYPDFPGLNLTYEVREGLVKHDTDYDVRDATGYEPEKSGSLECQLANIADELAYCTSDLDDGLRSGLLDWQEVRRLDLWQRVAASLQTANDGSPSDLLRARMIRRLVGMLITDAVKATAARIASYRVETLQDVRDLDTNLACFSAETSDHNRALKSFLQEKFYRHPRVVRMATKANRVLTALFQAYVTEPLQLPYETQERMRFGPDSPRRVICDYLAGMTDRYAIQEYGKLFDPGASV
jgi:dGTPase